MNDLPYYAKSHLRIRTKDAQLKPFVFNEAQMIVHAKLSEQLKETGRIRAIILKARQEGISTYTAGRFFRSIHLWPNQRATVVAHEKDKSSEIFEFYDRMYKNLIPEIQVPKIATQKGNLLHLAHDSSIVVDTAGDPDAGRGTTIQRLHGSELAFWPSAKETFISLMQAVGGPGSEAIIESTANGMGNFFHERWLAAESGESGFIAIFLPWWIHGEYELKVSADEADEIRNSDDPWEREAQDEGIQWEGKRHKLSIRKLAWRRKVGIPEKCAGDIRKFHQEYPSTAREAFIASGDTYFDKEKLEEYERATAQTPPKRRGALQKTDRDTIILRPDPYGHVRIWDLPKKDGLYVIGADTAEGKLVSGDPDDERGGRDFSSADVIEVNSNRQVAQLHGRVPPEVFARQLFYLGWFYGTGEDIRGPALVGVENNHPSGQTVLMKLRDWDYPALFYGRQPNVRVKDRVTHKLGWNTNKATRGPLLDGLAEEVRNETIDILSVDTIREMFTFVIDERGIPGALEGTHDDRVISLAIARLLARRWAMKPPEGKLPETQVYDSPSGAFDYGY